MILENIILKHLTEIDFNIIVKLSKKPVIAKFLLEQDNIAEHLKQTIAYYAFENCNTATQYIINNSAKSIKTNLASTVISQLAQHKDIAYNIFNIKDYQNADFFNEKEKEEIDNFIPIQEKEFIDLIKNNESSSASHWAQSIIKHKIIIKLIINTPDLLNNFFQHKGIITDFLSTLIQLNDSITCNFVKEKYCDSELKKFDNKKFIEDFLEDINYISNIEKNCYKIIIDLIITNQLLINKTPEEKCDFLKHDSILLCMSKKTLSISFRDIKPLIKIVENNPKFAECLIKNNIIMLSKYKTRINISGDDIVELARKNDMITKLLLEDEKFLSKLNNENFAMMTCNRSHEISIKSQELLNDNKKYIWLKKDYEIEELLTDKTFIDSLTSKNIVYISLKPTKIIARLLFNLEELKDKLYETIEYYKKEYDYIEGNFINEILKTHSNDKEIIEGIIYDETLFHYLFSGNNSEIDNIIQKNPILKCGIIENYNNLKEKIPYSIIEKLPWLLDETLTSYDEEKNIYYYDENIIHKPEQSNLVLCKILGEYYEYMIDN